MTNCVALFCEWPAPVLERENRSIIEARHLITDEFSLVTLRLISVVRGNDDRRIYCDVIRARIFKPRRDGASSQYSDTSETEKSEQLL